MIKRPLAVTVVGWLFVVAGVFGIIYHAGEINLAAPFETDVVLALIVRGLAVVGGWFLLRGANWARWLLLLWMAYHVILSTMHEVTEVVLHIVLLMAILFLLFISKAKVYFRKGPVTTRGTDR